MFIFLQLHVIFFLIFFYSSPKVVAIPFDYLGEIISLLFYFCDLYIYFTVIVTVTVTVIVIVIVI